MSSTNSKLKLLCVLIVICKLTKAEKVYFEILDSSSQHFCDNLRVNYSKALRLLKKKKFQDSLLEKTDVQLDNLEKMVI